MANSQPLDYCPHSPHVIRPNCHNNLKRQPFLFRFLINVGFFCLFNYTDSGHTTNYNFSMTMFHL